MRERLRRSGWLAASAVLLGFSGLAGCRAGSLPESAEGRPERGDVRHLVLITVDTWRADHAFVERAGTRLTPRLDELALESVRFTSAHSVAALTSAGVAGILTGLYPNRSGVIVNDHMLPAELPTIATRLRDEGFATAAFVANPVLAPGYGFENGFEIYELVPRREPLRKARAEQVHQQALAWLDGVAAGRPLFLWVHYMEPHGPYEPAPEMREIFDRERFDAARDLALQPEGKNSGWQAIPHYQQIGTPPSSDGRDYQLRYAAEVRSLDAALGELLAELDRRELLDSSVLVLGADHGEALAGDHGYYFSHDNGLTQDQLAVPLLIRYPGCDAGRAIDRPVSNVDILPTVLELLGVEPPPDLDGFSLLDPEATRTVFSQSARELALRDGEWKLRLLREGRIWRLTNLGSDPGEAADLAASQQSLLRDLRDRLTEMRRRPALAQARRRDARSAEEREALEALGYL